MEYVSLRLTFGGKPEIYLKKELIEGCIVIDRRDSWVRVRIIWPRDYLIVGWLPEQAFSDD